MDNLHEKISKAEAAIDELYERPGMDLEERTRQISNLRHKIACWQTRIDLREGRINHEAYVEIYFLR